MFLLVAPTYVWAQREAVLDKPFDEKTAIAKYIYSLVHYTKWPEKLYSKRICIIDDEKVFEVLQGVSNAPEFENTINIVKGDEYDYDQCNIIYVGKRSKLKEVLIASKGKAILTLSDVKGFAKKGGLVEFPYVNGKIAMRANLRSINRSKLVIDAELLSLMEILK